MNDYLECKYKIEFLNFDKEILFSIYIVNLECLSNEIRSRIYDYPRFDQIIITYVGDLKI